jgi:hypothetical protein
MSNYSGFPNSFGKPDHWQGATNWAAIQQGEKTLRYEYRLTWKVMGGKVRPGRYNRIYGRGAGRR